MSSTVSGKCILNHERTWSLLDNVSNSVVGANNVQVNDLSYIAAWRRLEITVRHVEIGD